MNRRTVQFIFAVMALLISLSVASQSARASLWPWGKGSPGDLDVSPAARAEDLAERFLKHYKPVSEDAVVKMPSYPLPLDLSRVTNLKEIEQRYLVKPEQKGLLKKNGFVVVRPGGELLDDMTAPYSRLLKERIPIYVTADTLLHLFHIQFDETLKEIEETVFYPDIVQVSKSLLEASQADYRTLKGDLKEAARRNVAYFSVALDQLDPKFHPPSFVRSLVRWESEQIEKHQGFPEIEGGIDHSYQVAREHALFRVPEDYSQYIPRGHYTRSETLKRYFKGMLWYGRMTFLLKGHEKKFGPIAPPAEALTDRETAKIQTLQAALISARSGQTTLPDGRKVTDVWDRLYAVSAFYSGFSDDLTLYDYRDSLREVFGAKFSPEEMEKEGQLNRFLLKISARRKPGIFSGTGGAGIDPGEAEGHQSISVEQLDTILGFTQGFRFMGQRYIPDSYVLGQMVSPGVGTIPRKHLSYTAVQIPDERIQPDLCYTIKGFPLGLDLFSVLGSRRAEALLPKEDSLIFPRYTQQLGKLRKEFAALGAKDWNRNLYWSWLYSLKALAEERRKGYQTYQQTEAWLDRQLNTALASWSALRHDTILYAKQSYTPIFVGITSVAPPPPPPKGLVEPLPTFFARVLTMAKMAKSGLADLDVLKGAAAARMESLTGTLEKLYDLCKRQVANQPLREEDNRFLSSFPELLKGAIGEVDEKGLKTTLITDVHTESNSRQVLQEGSGYVDYIIVAYKRPEGDVVLAVGPVLSYYEFKQPMNDRLTDEKWREMLQSGKTPARPHWVKGFYRE